MRIRIARHTDRLAELVAFYRDRVGLEETGGFQGHHGYDGVFFDIPGANAELELTTGGSLHAPAPHPESLLVLYCDTRQQVDEVASRMDVAPVIPENPFWREHALAFEDPDGFQVLLVAPRS